MDPMNAHFSPINGLESVKRIQFSLCGIPTNLIFAHRHISCSYLNMFLLVSHYPDFLITYCIHAFDDYVQSMVLYGLSQSSLL